MSLGFGDVVLHGASLTEATLEEKIDAATAGGFDGLSVLMTDLVAARGAGLGVGEIARRLSDGGLRVGEIEVVSRFPDGGPALFAELDRLLEVSDRLDAFSVNICLLGIPLDLDPSGQGAVAAAQADPERWMQASIGPLDRAAQVFGELCDRAAPHGRIVSLEFFPWTDLDLAKSASIVRAADRSNGRIHIDTWHYQRSDGPAQLPGVQGRDVACVQLSDGSLEPNHDVSMFEELGERLLPGEGEFDLVGLLRHLRETGFDGPVCGEVMYPWCAGAYREGTQGSADAAAQLARAMHNVMRRAFGDAWAGSA